MRKCVFTFEVKGVKTHFYFVELRKISGNQKVICDIIIEIFESYL